MTGRLAVFLWIGAANAGCVALDDCRPGQCSADAQITAEVRTLFDAHAALGPPASLSVQTRNGTVYLYGLVDTAMEQRLATSVAMQAHGAVRVVNLTGISNGR